MSKAIRSLGPNAEVTAQNRVLRITKFDKPGLGTLSALAYVKGIGAGKSSGIPTPATARMPVMSRSAQRRQRHIQDNAEARAEYIRLGIIKPVV